MKILFVLSFLILGLVTLNCGAQSSDVEKANEELYKVRIAISACLSDANTTQLDSAVVAWDGSPGMVTTTSEGGIVYDASDYLDSRAFKATYDVSQNGDITGGHNISWKHVEFDATYPKASHWVAVP